MRKIITNVSKVTHLAVVDDSNRTIGVVHILTGEQDITSKVLSAIEDDTVCDVSMLYGTTTDPDDYLKEIPNTTDLSIGDDDVFDSQSFLVLVKDRDDEEDEGYDSTYYLEPIEIY